MKRISIICALILSISLLTGCFPASLVLKSVPDEELENEMEEQWEDAWSIVLDRDEAAGEKDYYWKVLDAGDREIGIVTDEEQIKALDSLLSDDGTWGRRPEEGDPGEAACSYVYCQEKTLLAGQDPDEEREYEELGRFTVSASKDVVTIQILEDLPSLLNVDLGDFLTFTIDVPAETAEALRDPARFTEQGSGEES